MCFWKRIGALSFEDKLFTFLVFATFTRHNGEKFSSGSSAPPCDFCLAKAEKDSAGKCEMQAVWNSLVRRSTRACVAPPPPSKRNLAGTIEYRIFNTPPGNAKRGARQWLFLGTDSRSFILTWRFLYEPIQSPSSRDLGVDNARNSRTHTLHQSDPRCDITYVPISFDEVNFLNVATHMSE